MIEGRADLNNDGVFGATETALRWTLDLTNPADPLVKIVEGKNRRPVVAVGDFFQARVAPFLARLAPRGWVQWGLRMYYGLKKS